MLIQSSLQLQSGNSPNHDLLLVYVARDQSLKAKSEKHLNSACAALPNTCFGQARDPRALVP